MARKLPKYVRSVLNRNGDTYRYLFRRKGQAAITLAGPLYSEDFWATYAAALATVKGAAIGAGRIGPGTIDALCVSFYKSTLWTETLTDASRQTYRPIIEKLRAKDGSKRAGLLQPQHIAAMLDQIARPSGKKKLLVALRMLMTCAIPSLRTDDPTLGFKIKVPKGKSHHMWTDAQIAQYQKHHPLGTAARLVLEFALQTASRRMEVARLGPQHVKDGRIAIERCHGSRDVNVWITPELKAAIDAMPAIGMKTFIVGKRGKPLTPDTLAHEFAKWATEAGLPDCCRLHGLKRTSMSRMALGGCTTHEIQSVSGHKTLSMIQLYTDEVDREKLAAAAFEKIRGREGA